jgi:hypothetical protein
MNKKLYAFSGIALVLAMSATSLTVLAKDGNDNEGNQGKGLGLTIAPGQILKAELRGEDGRIVNGNSTQESASLNMNGDFTVTGVTVNSVNVSGNSVNVTLYGFTRDINVSGATFTGSASSLADIVAGDKLSATGNWNESTRVFSVKQIKDVTPHGTTTGDQTQRINQLLEIVRQLTAQLQALKGGH